MPSSRNSSDLDSEKVKEAASDIGTDAKHPAVYDKTVVDTAAVLVAGTEGDVDPQEAARLRRKLDWHLMPLMCILYLMTFADKTTLGQSAILGIKQGAHLNQNQFNWLGAVFYLSYLVFQYPQNLALQYFPIGKWISINVLVWAIALMCHAACHSFGALFAVRFIMGMAEGAITPGFMLVTAMFYTRAEQTKRVGYWYLMNGVAIIILGFLGFGVLHIHTGKFLPWQWLVIITGIMTLVVAVCFWLFFPDSPTTAWFLTPEERVAAVQRIRVNQAGVENKVWKRDQAIETLKDPKTWIFAVFAAVTNLLNSLTNQRQIIVNEFGFNTINTTLIGCVDGLVEIVAIWIAITVASAWPNGRIYAAVLCFIPSIVGSVLVSVLPFHIKGGLLVSYWLSIFAFPPFTIFLSWVSMVTAGHTKRTTTNAIVLASYGLGNTLGPFMWKAKYAKRNHVPWGIFTGVCVASAVLLLLARWLLARENTRRELEKHDDTFDEVYIAAVDKDGKAVEKHVDRAFLDLTDRQNRDFRYPL
ncbi:MFS general substrate transporter [Dentipellis sp. KUC8613]|nr:MFS general substrate transporter [Dentipellis sp. KUC8613]